MLQLSTVGDALDRIASAKSVRVQAYTLPRAVVRALEAAARRGADVAVELESAPFGNNHDLAAQNAKDVRALRAVHARAKLDDPIHAKTMIVDGSLYLDEKNFCKGDIVLRDDDRSESDAFAWSKRDALAREAAMLAQAQSGDRALVESETFGKDNATYAALDALGLAGASPRLLVSERELRESATERAALERLVRDGVTVRVCKDSAKLAVSGDGAWLGSANATYANGKYGMPDWGLCTKDATIVRAVRDRLENQWKRARNLEMPSR